MTELIRRFFKWAFAEEWHEFLWHVWSHDLYSRLDNIEGTYRTVKEMVMERKLISLGFRVECVFPRPIFTFDGEIPLTELPKHPTGFFEIVPSSQTGKREG